MSAVDTSLPWATVSGCGYLLTDEERAELEKVVKAAEPLLACASPLDGADLLVEFSAAIADIGLTTRLVLAASFLRTNTAFGRDLASTLAASVAAELEAAGGGTGGGRG